MAGEASWVKGGGNVDLVVIKFLHVSYIVVAVLPRGVGQGAVVGGTDSSRRDDYAGAVAAFLSCLICKLRLDEYIPVPLGHRPDVVKRSCLTVFVILSLYFLRKQLVKYSCTVVQSLIEYLNLFSNHLHSGGNLHTIYMQSWAAGAGSCRPFA